jgi:hypothetical protein
MSLIRGPRDVQRVLELTGTECFSRSSLTLAAIAQSSPDLITEIPHL